MEQKKKKKKKLSIKNWLFYALAGVGMAGLLTLHFYVSGYLDSKPHTISYVMFKKEVAAGHLEREGVIEDYVIKGKYKDGRPFASRYGIDGKSVQDFLDKHADKIDYKFVSPGKIDWSQVTMALLTVAAVFIGLWLVMKLVNRTQRSAVAGKTRLVAYDKEKHGKVTFNDVAGIDEAREEVKDIVDFLKNPEKFTRLGARQPSGVLLAGPPGTGKTLLARAMAGEANVPFFKISGSDFLEFFVGVGAARVREMFEKGRKHAPCIIFIDELDAIGTARNSAGLLSNAEGNQTLNQLLVEMNGFENQNQGIVVVGATNRHDVLDPALLRPGRFDRQVMVDYADINGRERILQVHTRNKKMAAGVNLREIAGATYGFSGADLEGITNEAAIIAAQKDQEGIGQQDLKEAIEKKHLGRQITRQMVEEEKKRLAYHEAGHAIVGLKVLRKEFLYKVTIRPRQNKTMGFAAFFNKEEWYSKSRRDLQNETLMLLGGRAAEEIIFDGDMGTGCVSDLERATALQGQIIGAFGMDDEFGPAVFQDNKNMFGESGESQDTKALKDRLVREHLKESLEKTKDILLKYEWELARLAIALLEHETLDGEQVQKIVGELS